jgi:hypothetical protein
MKAFYLPENPDYTIFDSGADSVRFARRCLVRGDGSAYRAISSFVNTQGEPMLWHDFGPLEGPGWAANTMGGACELLAWARHIGNESLRIEAEGLIDHVLRDGFIREDGFIMPYRHIQDERLCLNFKHNDDWFCPGSMARIASQMLWTSDLLPAIDPRRDLLRLCANCAADWIAQRVPDTESGWFPRRCAPDGGPYRLRAEGGPDPFFDSSGDGLFIVWLWTELTQRGLADYEPQVRSKADIFVKRGGMYGSINHDTYDPDENVAHAVAFRALIRAARLLEDSSLAAFAFDNSLAGLERFQIKEDRNGVATTGLLYMEDTWDTAYLWENAEAALAYMDAYQESGDRHYLDWALTILRACARHHYGPQGFLTEGVDWNNHVGQEHHIGGREFGAIQYTEPLLNNLHIVEPTLLFRSFLR